MLSHVLFSRPLLSMLNTFKMKGRVVTVKHFHFIDLCSSRALSLMQEALQFHADNASNELKNSCILLLIQIFQKLFLAVLLCHVIFSITFRFFYDVFSVYTS